MAEFNVRVYIALMFKAFILFVLYIAIGIANVYSQTLQSNALQAQPHARQISDEQGLPSMEIYHIHEDSNGYLWIGSNDGLSRYNGKEFKRFTTSNLSGKSITDILSTPDGRMYCHNFTGQIFEVGQEKLIELTNYRRLITKGFAVTETTDNNELWAGSDHGVYRYFNETKKWEKLEFPGFDSTIVNSFIWWIQRDETGRTWIINSHSGLWFSDDIKNWQRMPLLKKVKSGWTEDLLTANSRITFFEGSHYLFNRVNKKVYRLEQDSFREIADLSSEMGINSNVTGIWPIAADTILISSYTGFFWLNGKYELKQDQPFHQNLAISTIKKDREGNIWLGTLGSGLWMIPDLNKRVILPDPAMGRKISQISFESRNQKLFIGMQNGWIGRVDVSSKTLISSIEYPVSRNISALFYSEYLDRLYVGIDCLYVLNTDNGSLIQTLNITCNKKLVEGPAGSLLIANCMSLQAYPLKSEDWNKSLKIWGKYYDTFQKKLIFNRERCRTAIYDSKNLKIYAAYQSGLFLHMPDTTVELKNSENETIYALCMALSNDTLWVGTVSDGVYALSQNKEVLKFTTETGLKSNTITSLYFKDSLWIGNYEGIECIQIPSKKIYHWDKRDGLPSNEINDIIITNGQIWAATGNGLVIFPVNAHSVNTTLPLINLREVIVNNVPYNMDKKIKLSHTENNIVFTIDAINFRSWGSSQLNYRLLGLDTNWQIGPAGSNEIRFLALPEEKYTLQVKAINEDGLFSKQALEIPFEIVPPFWNTLIFKVVILLLSLILIFIYIKIFINRISLKNQLELEKTKLRLEKNQAESELRLSRLSAIKAQMNPHFIFNALNSIQSFFITDDKLKANEYLGKFSDLMRKVLDMSNHEMIPLKEEINALKLYLELEKLRFGDRFNYHLDIHLEEEAEHLLLPSMLIQPYVENAIKHGLMHKKGDKKLQIMFFQDKDLLDIRIEDNGIGRKRANEINLQKKKHQSFATNANQNRLDLLNSGRNERITVRIEDKVNELGESHGTCVFLQVPIVSEYSNR